MLEIVGVECHTRLYLVGFEGAFLQQPQYIYLALRFVTVEKEVFRFTSERTSLSMYVV